MVLLVSTFIKGNPARTAVGVVVRLERRVDESPLSNGYLSETAEVERVAGPILV